MAIWYNWNTSATTTTTITTSGGTGDVWSSWSNSVGTANYVTAASSSYIHTVSGDTVTVWTEWNGGNYYTYEYTPIELTKEQKRAERTRIREQRKRERIRIAEHKKLERIRLANEAMKEKKARQLLREVLTEEQDKQFEEKGYFELTSVSSGNRYRIKNGRSRNVQKIDKDGNVLQHLCFHPSDYVHNFDTMVAQKLMLESYEEEVKKVANFS